MRLQLIAAFLLAARVAGAQEPPPPEPEPAPVPTPEPASAPAEPAPVILPPPAERALDVRASLDVGAYHDTNAVSVLTPSVGAKIGDPLAGWLVNGRYLVDVVSAASPDIVATASPRWTEVRQAGSLGGRYKPGNFGVAGGASVSYSPDYLAIVGNVQVLEDLDDKNLTLSQGYGYGHDVIGRTGTSFAVFSRKFDYHTVSLGASRILNPALVVSLGADGVVERGDQSKPYRYIPIFTPAAAPTVPRGASAASIAAYRLQARPLERLPLERERAALTARVAWRLASSTLRIEQRGYLDTWNLHATTTDVRWLFDAGARVTWWPHVRLHLQNGVDFWQRAYAASGEHDLPALRTGDRELGPLTNVGAGGGLRLALGPRGKVDDLVVTTTADATYTMFNDALYVVDRISALVVGGIEKAF